MNHACVTYLTYISVDEMHCTAIQVKAIEHQFPVVLFILLYKVILTLECVDRILKCDHANESC